MTDSCTSFQDLDKPSTGDLSLVGNCFGAGVSMAQVLGKSTPVRASVGSRVRRTRRQTWCCLSHCWSGLHSNACNTNSVNFKLTLGHSEKE